MVLCRSLNLGKIGRSLNLGKFGRSLNLGKFGRSLNLGKFERSLLSNEAPHLGDIYKSRQFATADLSLVLLLHKFKPRH